MNITVAHVRKRGDTNQPVIYVGRAKGRMHMGNPFTHLLDTTLASVKVDTREQAVTFFGQWLDGHERWKHVEPVRRLYILSEIARLAEDNVDIMLTCWCEPNLCHAEIIAERIMAFREDFFSGESNVRKS